MTKQGTPNAPSERRLSRDLRLVIGAIVMVVAATAAYLGMVISGTNSIRTRSALERNSDTAQLCARLLDVQCESAVSLLEVLSERPGFANHLRDRSHLPLTDYLGDAVRAIPDLETAAIYGVDGQWILSYPSRSRPPGSAANDSWFREVSRTQKPFIQSAPRLKAKILPRQDFMIIALPIRNDSGSHSAGYLLSYYRLKNIQNWLRRVQIRGGKVLVFDRGGTIIADGGENSSRVTPDFSDQRHRTVLKRAFRGESGSIVTDEEIVAFAPVSHPDWAVVVSQSVDSAFASSEYLLRRLTLILVPVLLLLTWTGWLLVTLYHRQQALARQLAERNEVLRRQDRAKSDLLANVSHGLKTPIASMQLSVSGVLERGPGSSHDQAEECLNLVSQELDELEGRVRNLLDMSRLDAGTAPIWREPCDLTDIAASALERLRPLLKDRPIDARFPLEPLMVECDQTQMETVLINLLENAVKYSPTGSTLHLRGDSAGDFAMLSIRDEGPGVAEADRERIFEKFYRASTHPRTGGTGLGLAICRAVVEAHGGTISIVSPAGAGAEFMIRLPQTPEVTL